MGEKKPPNISFKSMKTPLTLFRDLPTCIYDIMINGTCPMSCAECPPRHTSYAGLNLANQKSWLLGAGSLRETTSYVIASNSYQNNNQSP